MNLLLLIVKNIGRNKLRTILTSLGIMVLVFVMTLVWSVLWFLDVATSEKSANLKAIVTERWQIPSRMPFAYANSLAEGAFRNEGDVRVQSKDSMTWQFYGGSLEQNPKLRNASNSLFAIAMEASKLTTMMDELDSLPAASLAVFQKDVDKLGARKNGILIGKGKLKDLNKQIGDQFKIYSLNYKEIDLEFEIVGTFPDGRYDQSAAMNRDYLNDAMDKYPATHGNRKHPMSEKCLNLVWLRVKDAAEYGQVSGQIEASPFYGNPAVKCETASSGVAVFLDAYRDLLAGVKWLLSPAMLVVLSLIIANSISISVRERRLELAVLKVLGFQPYQLLILVLGEALLLGTLSGLTSALLTYGIINEMGGINFRIAFFAAFMIPGRAILWGLLIGLGTAFVGSIFPALAAQRVKASEVFSKVA